MPEVKDPKRKRKGSDEQDSVGGKGNEKETLGLKRKDYESRLRELHVKLVKLQECVPHDAKKICIVFDGRDGAGKGGAIKAITPRTDGHVTAAAAHVETVTIMHRSG